MKLYNLVSEEDSTQPIISDRTKSLTIEGDGFKAGVVTINPNLREQNIDITIRKLSYDKSTANIMTNLLKSIGKVLVEMSNGALGKEPYLTDWSYSIDLIDFDLGDVINKDNHFRSSFVDGSNSFANTFVDRKKPLSDLYSDVIRGVLPWRLDVPKIEEEYLKAKRRLEFIQSEHFTEGEYDGYEYKTILNSANIESNHRTRLSANDTIDGKTVIINAYSLQIKYYTELVGNKKPEFKTPSSWDEKLAKHVIRDYFVNGVYGILTVYVTASTIPNHHSGVSVRTNEYHFNRDEII